MATDCYRIHLNVQVIRVYANITHIGSYAFAKMPSLREIRITDKTEVENADTDIRWRNGGLVWVDDWAFADTKIKTHTLPTTLKKMGNLVFYNSLIETIDLSRTQLESISDDTFRECSSLYKVTLPNSIKSIGANAFFQCTSLREINFPDSLNLIGVHSFRSTALTSVDLSNTQVELIGYGAFLYCNINELKFPKSITEIGAYAFYETKVTSIDFRHTKLKLIAGSCFSLCTSLRKVLFPASLEFVSLYAFHLTGVESIDLSHTQITEININTFGFYYYLR
ncbi:MAG: leucine-rich repeat domain-containing protein, partial [Tannerellaceae bacterium]|nr:leucine-rich repeat domain-containing protein [Tannerellaceae bacterium]